MVIRLIFRDIKKYFKLKIFQNKWLKHRGDNYTQAGTVFPSDKVKIGKWSYGILNVHYYNQLYERLEIGKYCSIADNVHFFTGGEHDIKNISTYPFKNRISKNAIQEAISKGPIVIGDDVWIGSNSIILSGVKIGKGAVIAAGSIVAKDVPEYGIFINNRPIRYRFDEEIRTILTDYDLNRLNLKNKDELMDLLYTNLNKDNIEIIMKKLKESE